MRKTGVPRLKSRLGLLIIPFMNFEWSTEPDAREPEATEPDATNITDQTLAKETDVPERRSSGRIKGDSPLSVRGFDTTGSPFFEMTTVHDISEGGVSFFTKSPVWVDSLLQLVVCYINPEETRDITKRKTAARVLRTYENGDGHQFVVGCFENLKLNPDDSD